MEKMGRNSAALVFALLLGPGLVSAAQRDLGGADALFPLLLSPSGARSLSLGHAFEAVQGGAEGTIYNPAQAAYTGATEAAFHHEALFAGSSRETLLLCLPTGKRSAMTASANYVQYASMQLRDSQGKALGAFQPADYGIGLGGGFELTPGLALGLSARALREQVPTVSLRGVAGDLGLLGSPMQDLNLGLVLRLRPTQDADASGMSFKPAVGASYTMTTAMAGTWLGALSAEVDPERSTQVNVGLEQAFRLQALGLALRCGLSGTFPRLDGVESAAMMGAGLKFGAWSLDYAYAPMGNLGNTQQLSLTWRAAP